MRQLTKKEAIRLAKSGRWRRWPIPFRARFQLEQRRLCMDFSAYHEAVESLLGRPVWTHEFAHPDVLLHEADGEIAPPKDFEAILRKLPRRVRDKVIVIDRQ